MKKSSAVPATLVASMAALFVVGCNSGRNQCVDANGNVIPDQVCRDSERGFRSGSYAYPHWIYRGGSNSFGSFGGSTGGGTSRGGFGSGSSGSHGGFGG